MINKRTLQQWIPPTVCAVLLAGSMAVSQAQPFTNFIYCQFDTGDPRANGWPDNTSINLVKWWGEPDFAQEWDGTMNATTTLGPNNSGSGSLKVTVNWTPGQNQLCLWQQLNGVQNWWDPDVRVNGFYYDMSFDIRFDPSSAQTAAGDYGHLQFGLSTPSWNQVWLKDIPHFPVTNGWMHVNCPIDPAVPGVDQITAFIFDYPWQPNAITNTQTFWLDNIIFQTNLNKNLKPPTLTLASFPATPGLHLSSAGASQYDRNSIESALSQTWVGKGDTPVSYSFTVIEYPGTNYPNLQTHIFLCSNPGTEVAPDYNEANAVFVQLQNNPDGSAGWSFMYKTNDPGDNHMFFNQQPGGQYGTNGYGQGLLGTLTEPNGPLGTWTLTFLNDTNVTMTSPSGLTANFFFPDDTAVQTAFAEPVRAYFGAQPNSTAAIGQEVILSEVKITGTDNPLDDHFTGLSVDTTVWTVRATEAVDVSVVPNNIAFKLTWALPDLHFSLQMAPTLNGPWTDPGLTNTTVNAATKTVLVPRSILPSTTATYFRMVKRVATQLQVLMPGETAAPGTLTGKTGTPDPQFAYLDVAVTVHAVDNNWNLADSVTDTVAITSSDATALLPNNAALAGGTGTFHIIFGTPGSWTVTATDVTSTTVAPNTGSPTTVQ